MTAGQQHLPPQGSLRGNLVIPAPFGPTLARRHRQRQGRRRAALPCHDKTFEPGRTWLPLAAGPRLRSGREGVPACQQGEGPFFPVPRLGAGSLPAKAAVKDMAARSRVIARAAWRGGQIQGPSRGAWWLGSTRTRTCMSRWCWTGWDTAWECWLPRLLMQETKA